MHFRLQGPAAITKLQGQLRLSIAIADKAESSLSAVPQRPTPVVRKNSVATEKPFELFGAKVPRGSTRRDCLTQLKLDWRRRADSNRDGGFADAGVSI